MTSSGDIRTFVGTQFYRRWLYICGEKQRVTTRPLAVGLVGAGAISTHHLAGWAERNDAKVVAICEPEPQRAKERAAQFGIAKTYASLDEMLDAEQLDVIDILTPRETHVALIEKVEKRGLPVICQKPLAPTLAEATDIAERVRDQTRLMVHENWRFRPYYRRLKQLLTDGVLGRALHIDIAFYRGGLNTTNGVVAPGLARQPFMATEPRLLVAESLIHHIDVARWLVGPLKLSASHLKRTSDLVVGEDSAVLVFTGASGETVSIRGSMHAAGHDFRADDEFSVAGTKSSARYQNGRLDVSGETTSSETFDYQACYQGSFSAVIAHFCEQLKSGAPFETAPEDHLQTLALVEEIYARSGISAG